MAPLCEAIGGLTRGAHVLVMGVLGYDVSCLYSAWSVRIIGIPLATSVAGTSCLLSLYFVRGTASLAVAKRQRQAHGDGTHPHLADCYSGGAGLRGCLGTGCHWP